MSTSNLQEINKNMKYGLFEGRLDLIGRLLSVLELLESALVMQRTFVEGNKFHSLLNDLRKINNEIIHKIDPLLSVSQKHPFKIVENSFMKSVLTELENEIRRLILHKYWLREFNKVYEAMIKGEKYDLNIAKLNDFLSRFPDLKLYLITSQNLKEIMEVNYLLISLTISHFENINEKYQKLNLDYKNLKKIIHAIENQLKSIIVIVDDFIKDFEILLRGGEFFRSLNQVEFLKKIEEIDSLIKEIKNKRDLVSRVLLSMKKVNIDILFDDPQLENNKNLSNVNQNATQERVNFISKNMMPIAILSREIEILSTAATRIIMLCKFLYFSPELHDLFRKYELRKVMFAIQKLLEKFDKEFKNLTKELNNIYSLFSQLYNSINQQLNDSSKLHIEREMRLLGNSINDLTTKLNNLFNYNLMTLTPDNVAAFFGLFVKSVADTTHFINNLLTVFINPRTYLDPQQSSRVLKEIEKLNDEIKKIKEIDEDLKKTLNSLVNVLKIFLSYKSLFLDFLRMRSLNLNNVKELSNNHTFMHGIEDFGKFIKVLPKKVDTEKKLSKVVKDLQRMFIELQKLKRLLFTDFGGELHEHKSHLENFKSSFEEKKNELKTILNHQQSNKLEPIIKSLLDIIVDYPHSLLNDNFYNDLSMISKKLEEIKNTDDLKS